MRLVGWMCVCVCIYIHIYMREYVCALGFNSHIKEIFAYSFQLKAFKKTVTKYIKFTFCIKLRKYETKFYFD